MKWRVWRACDNRRLRCWNVWGAGLRNIQRSAQQVQMPCPGQLPSALHSTLDAVLHDLVRGIRMNHEVGRHGPQRWRWFARLKLASNASLGCGEHHRVEDELSGSYGESDECHIHSVTHGALTHKPCVVNVHAASSECG